MIYYLITQCHASMVHVRILYCMIIDDHIDGDTFIELPSDKAKLKQELGLTRGGANKVSGLLSEIQTHQPGLEDKKFKEEKGEWLEI